MHIAWEKVLEGEVKCKKLGVDFLKCTFTTGGQKWELQLVCLSNVKL